MMILCKPKSVGSVGRDELAKRIDDFEGGRWVEVLAATVAFIQSKPTLANTNFGQTDFWPKLRF